MADECRDFSKTITTFLLNTCRLPPRLSQRDVEAVVHCAWAAGSRPTGDEEAEVIPLITGSVAEFYIEPMLPHVGDIDVMTHLNTMLAIPRGHPPPTQLPAEFHNYVRIVKIIDSHLPGYVYLLVRYLLTQCTDDEKYNYIEYDEEVCLSNKSYRLNYDKVVMHGPAVFTDLSFTSYLSLDFVNCIRCLSWPSQAADWPARHRNYGWPDSATLDRVVNNGCDVVPVAHRLCRQDKWMGKLQWRLSFSRAEIVLINSWMPVQQIVYHMLRYFMKTEGLTDCADNAEAGTLSNYHIKTLMLWACELNPKSWWTKDLSLVRICVELLHTLSVWLTDTCCSHYFVKSCSLCLLANPFSVKNVANKLMLIDEEYLTTWFINNYVGQCAQLCPDYILQLFDDVSSSVKLQNVVSEIVRWRLQTSLRDLWLSFDSSECVITSYVSVHSVTVRSCVYLMNELTKIDRHLSVYFSAVALLHVVCKILRNSFSDGDVAILLTIFGRNVNQTCNDLSLRITGLITSELVDLLQKSAVEYLTTYRHLMARDFGSLATIVTTDFEAMFAYKCGDYQRCLQLFTQNVHTLLYAIVMPNVSTHVEFIQLLDDDIVSLTALMLIINPKCRNQALSVCISQLTLSVYLMTQCQLKLHHSVTSLAQTLEYINVAQTRQLRECTLDQLTLKFIERKVYLTTCP